MAGSSNDQQPSSPNHQRKNPGDSSNSAASSPFVSSGLPRLGPIGPPRRSPPLLPQGADNVHCASTSRAVPSDPQQLRNYCWTDNNRWSEHAANEIRSIFNLSWRVSNAKHEEVAQASPTIQRFVIREEGEGGTGQESRTTDDLEGEPAEKNADKADTGQEKQESPASRKESEAEQEEGEAGQDFRTAVHLEVESTREKAEIADTEPEEGQPQEELQVQEEQPEEEFEAREEPKEELEAQEQQPKEEEELLFDINDRNEFPNLDNLANRAPVPPHLRRRQRGQGRRN